MYFCTSRRLALDMPSFLCRFADPTVHHSHAVFHSRLKTDLLCALDCLILQDCLDVLGLGLGLRLGLGLGLGLQVTVSHPPGGRLPLLSARPAVTSPAAEHHRLLAGTKLYCLVTEAHRCKQLA